MTTEWRSKGQPPGLTKPDASGASHLDPATGELHICRVDLQQDHAFQVWHQRYGWLAPVPYDRNIFSPVGGFRFYVAPYFGVPHYKVECTNYVDGAVGVADLGPVPA